MMKSLAGILLILIGLSETALAHVKTDKYTNCHVVELIATSDGLIDANEVSLECYNGSDRVVKARIRSQGQQILLAAALANGLTTHVDIEMDSNQPYEEKYQVTKVQIVKSAQR